MSKGVWVLTRKINAYEQDGEYFVAVWGKKPTLEQLARHFGYLRDAQTVIDYQALAFLIHVEKGGGRQAIEYEWFNLRHVPFGEVNNVQD